MEQILDLSTGLLFHSQLPLYDTNPTLLAKFSMPVIVGFHTCSHTPAGIRACVDRILKEMLYLSENPKEPSSHAIRMSVHRFLDCKATWKLVKQKLIGRVRSWGTEIMAGISRTNLDEMGWRESSACPYCKPERPRQGVGVEWVSWYRISADLWSHLYQIRPTGHIQKNERHAERLKTVEFILSSIHIRPRIPTPRAASTRCGIHPFNTQFPALSGSSKGSCTRTRMRRRLMEFRAYNGSLQSEPF